MGDGVSDFKIDTLERRNTSDSNGTLSNALLPRRSPILSFISPSLSIKSSLPLVWKLMCYKHQLSKLRRLVQKMIVLMNYCGWWLITWKFLPSIASASNTDNVQSNLKNAKNSRTKYRTNRPISNKLSGLLYNWNQG